ncbi:MAG: hypothetical protein U0136_05920 [Bdellovibrionota bacterium]
MKNYILVLTLLPSSVSATQLDPGLSPVTDVEGLLETSTAASEQPTPGTTSVGGDATGSPEQILSSAQSFQPIEQAEKAPGFIALLPEDARRWPPENRAGLKLLLGDGEIDPGASSLIPLVTRP